MSSLRYNKETEEKDMNKETNRNEKGFDIVKAAYIQTITLILICVVGSIAATLCVFRECDKAKKLSNQITEEKRELASLQLQGENKESAEGRRFMFGTGYYKSETENKICYYFYEKQPEGGYQLVKLDADDVQICPELEGGDQPYEIITKNGYDVIKYRQMYLPKDAIQTTYDANISNMEAKNVSAGQKLE